jgi:hypothetical protein
VTLTAPQRKALEILNDGEAYAPRDFARAMWPDSPAWTRRSRGQRGTNRSGAMAGTMPMLGAKMLWHLYDLGYVTQRDSGDWRITSKGREALK